MKKEDEDPEKTGNQDEEGDNLNIEELTEVQGGIDDHDESEQDCGLGCYVGSGAGTKDEAEPDSLD